VAVCLLSILLAMATNSDWLPGVTYMLLGPLQALNGWMHGRRIRVLAGSAPAAS
jgi:hypothetical protein